MTGFEGPLLSARSVTVKFGGLTAVDCVDGDVSPGEIVGLMGPNGAGKTTFFNALSGHQAVTEGTVTFAGTEVTAVRPHLRARMGLARTFQMGGLVLELTVLENVVLGLDHRQRISHRRQSRRELVHAATELLGRYGLAAYANNVAVTLGAGLRRRVEVVRVLAAQPRMVLLDEPAAGLSPDERDDLAELLRLIKAQDVAILVTEHASDFLFAVADRIMVMNFGKKLLEDVPSAVRTNATVLSAYLGTEG